MTTAPNESTTLVPNHHGDHPGFSGLRGWIAAQTMRFGRTRVADLAIELTGPVPGQRLVDIGCGPGVAALRAASRGATTTGIDPADVMLGQARRADKANAVTWKVGVAESLPLPDDSCDIAWSLATVHHWPDLDGGLAEVQRVLVAGGQFLAIERLTKPGATGLASHGWTKAQAERFAELCQAAGWERATVSIHDAGRGKVVAVLATGSAAEGR